MMPDVRTDLGTMLLSTGVADQAVNQYKKVLETHPKFFEANFNLGVAYEPDEQRVGARAALDQALKLAPDDAARNRVNEMLAALSGVEGRCACHRGSGGRRPARRPGPPGNAVSATGEFKGALEQMLRDLPIAGSQDSISASGTSATQCARD